METDHHISINVRCLLWRKDVPRQDWEDMLVRRTGLDRNRARSLLNGNLEDAALTQKEVEMLAEIVGLGDEPDNLRHSGYALADCNVLMENLKYLLNSLEHGRKGVTAKEIGVDATTLSRWVKGSLKPKISNLRRLVAQFGLPPGTDLKTEPVFLAAQPITVVDRRQWLHDRIQSLQTHELQALYPALRLLLEER